MLTEIRTSEASKRAARIREFRSSTINRRAYIIQRKPENGYQIVTYNTGSMRWLLKCVVCGREFESMLPPSSWQSSIKCDDCQMSEMFN